MNLIANFLIFASIQWSLLQEQNKETVCKFRFWVSGGKTRIPNHFWFFSKAAQDVIILIETVLSTVFAPAKKLCFHLCLTQKLLNGFPQILYRWIGLDPE